MPFWNNEKDGQQLPPIQLGGQQGFAQQQGQPPAQQPGTPAPAPAQPHQSLEERFNLLMKNSTRTPAIDLAIQISDLVLEEAVANRASDVHFEYHGNNLRIRFRVDGILQDALTLPRNQNIPITQRLRVLAGFDPEPPSTYRTEEGRFQKILAGRPIQVRLSAFPTINGEKLVLRVLDRNQMGLNLDQLGLTQEPLSVLKRVVHSPYGIFFVTGATGSGKTTTLYAMVKTVSSPMINVITLEDPVEYRLEGINQAQINYKTGFTWGEGLRSILRQDPDIVMVGEVRDHETAEISMRAALTGHLIFTTLHTISAPGVVERLFEMGTPPFLIASSVLGSMAQRLVRKVCPQCAQDTTPPPQAAVDDFVKSLDPAEARAVREIIYKQGGKFKIEKGCPACRNTGYLGRTGIFEMMLMNEELRKHVLDHSATDAIKRAAVQSGGMRTLIMDGMNKAWLGQTTISEVLRVTATMV
jgi:type II secretory ATPase GspE/PulE/Tfp pilus assembly ATPase PilB-like protein